MRISGKLSNEIFDASDYYVLIIGKMFGSEVPGEGISYTQKEYRYAVKQGIPVLAFLMKDDADVAKTYQETDKKRIEKLKAFRKEVETGNHRTGATQMNWLGRSLPLWRDKL